MTISSPIRNGTLMPTLSVLIFNANLFSNAIPAINLPMFYYVVAPNLKELADRLDVSTWLSYFLYSINGLSSASTRVVAARESCKKTQKYSSNYGWYPLLFAFLLSYISFCLIIFSFLFWYFSVDIFKLFSYVYSTW